jgi:benzoyl-CoA reductase/2-hydroxyglutaryl-CoA dehydratase subunit BcrC/BadD/HgdB
MNGFWIATPLTRRDHLVHQKETGRRVLGVLPIHYPKPLLTALGLLVQEIWGPPGAPRSGASGRIQTYGCAVVRNAMGFLASEQAAGLDGVLFPHTCDSIQGLATQITDLGGWDRPAFVFQHPRMASRESARRYLDRELRSLAGDLAAWTGQELTEARLAWALDLHDEIDASRLRLLEARARLPWADTKVYALLRRGEWLWPEEHLLELRAACRELEAARVQQGVPVLVTGYVPEPPGLLAALNGAGAIVAADDYAAVGRRIPRNGPAGSSDPWTRLAERQLAHPPCPTQGGPQADRIAHLTSLAERAGARGVLVHGQKFCEPELFDVPAITRAFAAKGLPSLVLEGELEPSLSGQTETRIEAFVELLLQGGGR